MNKFKILDKAKLIDFFNEHWYEIENTDYILPSVTSILDKTIAKGFGFNQFLMNTGNESKVIVREAADSGSKLHNAFEQLILGNEITAEFGNYTKEEWKKIYNFVEWYRYLKIEPIITEQTVYDIDLGYAGTADFICKIDGEVWLLDWKTGNNVYDTANLQVSAYATAWNKSTTPMIQRCAIIHVGAPVKTFKDFNAPGIKFIEVDFKENFETFLSVLNIYKKLYPNEKAPTTLYPLTLKLESEKKDEN